MAKEVKVKVNKKGKVKAEYPKLIKVGEHTLNEKGQGVAEKVRVNNAEEEAEVRKKYKLEDKASEDKKPAGWGNK